MLKLSETWPSMNAGLIAIDLTGQVRGRLRRLVACKLIRAAFDLLADDGISSPKRLTACPIKVLESHCNWRVAETRYRYVTAVNDRSMLDCVANENEDVLHLIVPPGKSWLAKAALCEQFGGRAPDVIAFDEFIAMRLLFSSFDRRCGLIQVKARWFEIYNRIVQTLDEQAKIAIDVRNKP